MLYIHDMYQCALQFAKTEGTTEIGIQLDRLIFDIFVLFSP